MSVQSPTDKWRTRFGGTWRYNDYSYIAAKSTRKQDLIVTSSGAGLRYRDSDTGERASLAVHAWIITAGDLDGDGKGDILSLWPDDGV